MPKGGGQGGRTFDAPHPQLVGANDGDGVGNRHDDYDGDGNDDADDGEAIAAAS